MNICCQPFAKLVFKVILLCLAAYTETFPTETGVGVFRPWKTWSLIGTWSLLKKRIKSFSPSFLTKFALPITLNNYFLKKMCSVRIRTRDNRVLGAHVSSGLWGLPSIYSVCYYFILHASLLGTGTLNARTVAGKLLLNYHRSTLIVPNN